MKIIREKEENLAKETKKRIEKLTEEFNGKELVVKVFENKENYDQIIAQVGIPFLALCEHHEISFEGTVDIAFIPDKWWIGLSKLARITEKHLNPTIKTIQEKATHLILNDIVECLKPKGAMVIIEAKHGCICYRGVKKPSLTITSAIYGAFQNSVTKQEFLSLRK